MIQDKQADFSATISILLRIRIHSPQQILKMRSLAIAIALCSALCLSCATRVYLNESSGIPKRQYDSLVILKNPVSLVIPVAIYPEYKDIKYHVKGGMPAVVKIDSMLQTGLEATGINSLVRDTIDVLDSTTLYLVYQDYWAWDLKKYMHVLWIGVYDSGENLKLEVISQGNTAGLHDFPTPQKQVPIMIQELVAKLPEYLEAPKSK